jgi:dihydroflavonol-4-reductase
LPPFNWPIFFIQKNLYLYKMILITGATGLLGAYLLAGLSHKGEKVRAIKRAGSDLSIAKKIYSYYGSSTIPFEEAVEWVEGDILDCYSLSEAMEGVEKVYHSAALVSFNAKDRGLLMKVNGDGTANVMNAAMDACIKKVCHVSSVAALGKAENSDIITENNWWKNSPGNSFYGISKYTGEREAWRAMEEGLDVVIVNPSIILGAGNWDKGSASLFSAAYKGMHFYTSGITGFVDASDVAECMIKLMDGPFKNERYILSSGNLPFRDLFNAIHDEFGRKRPSYRAGIVLTGITWRAEAIKSLFTSKPPLITKETARAANSRIYFSNEKVVKALGYEFRPMETTIKELCSLYLKEAQLDRV